MNELGKNSVAMLTIDEGSEGQRIDNYLLKLLKGVPKSHIYRILRKGEVRANKKRVDATYRLVLGDIVRVPPVQTARREPANIQPVSAKLAHCTLFEDSALLVINKPSGMAVHGGSGISRGVIEQLRLERPELKFLELAHRLDRETSGVLLLAKKRSALVALHEAMRSDSRADEGGMDKFYFALVKGNWPDARRHVKLPLFKYLTADGERRVCVREDGKPSHTIFTLQQKWDGFSLLEAELRTGRTHQIRVHLSHLGFPIAGDDKYGDFPWNKELQRRGLKRMFLHAHKAVIRHPLTGETLTLEAPLPQELERFLLSLEKPEHAATI
ncbi:MAG: RluA family pseudouridine synthase [Sulfurimicrobium sp.]|nr:RluA family pseudouridine synthase [Sulfurimicrobium sp.]